MGELVTEAREINERLRVLAVLNAADSQGKDNEDALAALTEIAGIETAPLMIVRRKAFPNAAAAGRAVTEHQPRDTKAAEEMMALSRLLFSDTSRTASVYRTA
jgi:chromosome partitioning protein